MTLVNPKDLILNCDFADAEHLVIANALNAIGKLLLQNEKDLVFNTVLPTSLDYLQKHLYHEERVLINAFEFWIEEIGWGDIYENLKMKFRNFLNSKGKDLDNYEYRDFMDFKTQLGFDKEEIEILKWWQLVENQKHGHKNVANHLMEELKKIDTSAEPKKIVADLGMVISYVLSRVLKLDKKYVDFYREKGIPACGEKPLLPPAEVVQMLKEILKGEFVEPLKV